MRLRLALWLCLMVACGGKPSVSLPAGPSLGVAPPKALAPKDGPLSITYFAPTGETRGGQLEVNISFDRPMVELGRDDAPAIEITPEVPGRTRWVGSQTLLFEPSAPLPMGTEFHARVAGLTALDGKALAAPLSFSFATPALALVSHSAQQIPSQHRKTPFELWFNAPVAVSAVEAATSLELVGAERRAVPFAVEADPENARHVRVTPKQAYPLASRVELTLRAGLRGQEGPRPLARDEVLSLSVYGPLRVLPSPACEGEQCVPMLSFSNPVRTKDAFAKLVFEPPLAAPYVHEEDYVTDQLYFGQELAPATTYRVRVVGPLRDVYGTQLTGERSAIVRTPPLPALAQLLVTGDHSPGVAGTLRAQLQHLEGAQLELYRLAGDEVLPTALDAITPKARPIRKTFPAVGPVDRKVVEVDTAAALPQGKGIVLAVLSAQSKHDRFEQRKLLTYGDLAPSLKLGQRDGVVWVTKLSTAEPVQGARVRIVRGSERIAEGMSDARGVFAFGLPIGAVADEYEDIAAVVEKGDEIAFTHKHAGIGPWEVSERGSFGDEGATRAHLFTERGIYRPGDTVKLKGILRDADANGLTPSRGEVTVHVRDASGADVETSVHPLSPYGSFAHEIRVPGSVELGPLSITVDHGGQDFQESVEIAEYRPAELEATLTPDRELALAGEQVKAKLSARYLFGAPAQRAHVYWSARYVTRPWLAKGFEGFTFHDRDVESEAWDSVAGSGEAELDAHGELMLTTKLGRVPADGPSALEVEASINVDNTQLSARTRVDVLPASVVVGVRPFSSVLEHDKPFEAELVVLSPDGSARAGIPIGASLSRRTWSYEEGHWVPHEERVASCKATSKARAVRCGLNTREPGLYVVRAQAKDGAGRVSRAAEYVYVWGEGTTGWGEQDERIIALHAERPQYKLGETAKILVPSPFARAEALVTVEREGVLSSERVQLGSAGTIDVAIDQRFVPNAFVSVLLLAPLGEVREGPAFRVGTVELTADVSDRKLSVEVKPEAVEKRPGEELSVALAVKDVAGQPVQAELTVFAVDEGVLALTGYRTPDPFAAIYAPHGLSVWTSDVRSALQRVLDAADEDKGGDEGGGGGAELMRSNFSAVAVYVPSLETDAQGHASLRFKLPDSTTRFRVMAVAASRASSLGAGEATVRTKKPLMMRPLLPRLLRAGDTLQAGVVVHNELDAELATEVTLAAEGLSLAQPAQQRVTVPAHGAVQVRYALRAERVGTAKLTFRAAGGAERDALTLTREVLSPSVMETMSIAGATKGAMQEALAPLQDMRADVGGLELSLAASALVELEQPARKLFAYPYGCSEQLASRLIALASLERMRKPLALAESFADAAEPVLSELEKHQNADGSFGLWRADDSAVPWLQRFLTAYALIAFDRLQHAGIAVSPHAAERARAFLTRTLRDENQPEERVFMLYALARTGTVELGYAHKLFEQRAQLSLLARIELAHALTKLNEKQAAQTMLDELGSEVRVASDRAHVESAAWHGALESDVRASGALLQMLLEHAPDHVLVPKLARWLSAARGRDGAYVNTQQTAWAVMSLADYLVAREAVPPALKASVRLGARALGPFALAGHRASAHASLPMQDLPRAGAPVVLSREGSGTLYYGLQLNYAPRELPKRPIERGFFVERSYERIAPGALSRGDTQGEAGARAKLEDYVRITLRVAVPSAREFVMLEDELPAGLEPVDTQLATEFSTAARALSARAPEDHRELRDRGVRIAINDLPAGLYHYSYLARATTPGQFVAPPAHVEEMYHPDTQGLTAATQFTIEAP